MQRRRKTSKEERICSICSQAFNKAEHLERHFRSHTKEKPFRCQTCDKVFARQDTLLRHSRSHQADGQRTNRRARTHKTDDGGETASLSALSSSIDVGEDSVISVAGFEVPSISQPAFSEDAISHNENIDPNLQPAIDPSDNHMIESFNPAHNDMVPSDGGLGQQFDMLSHWTPEMDLDSQWMSCFAGENFNVDVLNFSLPFPNPEINLTQMDLQPMMSNPPQPPAMTPISEPSLKPESAIQTNWHTWTIPQGISTSGYNTPDPGQARFNIDETCHKIITERLQPRVQEGPVPSIEFLNLCIQAYFVNFHPIFPIIHAPSFRPSPHNGLLLLSICTVGSLFLGSHRALSRGISIFERLNKHILSTWESHLMKRLNTNMVALQASAIGQIFGLLVGRPKDLMQVELFHGCLVAWARRLKLFEIQEHDIDVSQLDGDELEIAWKDFISVEVKNRIVLAIHLHDAEIGSLFHHNPVLHHDLSLLPATCSNEAFAAPNAVAWKEAMMHQMARKAAMPILAPDSQPNGVPVFPAISSDFGLYVMLEQIGALTYGHSRKSISWPATAQRCQHLLMAWYNRYRNTSIFERHAPSLMLLWHSMFMLVYMDLDMLESGAGRDGPEPAERHHNGVLEWTRSTDAMKCMIHSVLAQKHFERIPLGVEPPIYAPQCLYRCGVAWYCYNRFGGGMSESQGELDMSELQGLGVNSTALFLDEVAPKYGRPAAGSLFKIIDLLQRITHWKVAHNFASTLLLLFEEGQSIL